MLSHSRQAGQSVIILIIAILIVASFMFVGGFKYKKPKEISNTNTASSNYQCCDSGSGNNCRVNQNKTFTWKGTNDAPEEYGLIKSNAFIAESGHLKTRPAPDDKTPDGRFIFTSNMDQSNPYCSGQTNVDIIGGYGGCIPNDQILYVCNECTNNTVGTGTFDVYFRTGDGDIPDVLANCRSVAIGPDITNNIKLTFEADGKKENLQLQTLKPVPVVQTAPWLSPYCKPAIYLYPKDTSMISVTVNSSQPFTYTDPVYPAGGWKVIADSNGIIYSNNKIYSYLYYETQIDDSVLKKPPSGYVVTSFELNNLLARILPQLGLNIKESGEFKDYWIDALPKSKYYFVGIVPQEELSAYSTLDIFPRPSTEIRVTLYFETLNEKIEIDEPEIITPIRSGFTVVEWGGIYKKHPGEKFSCFM